jgi:hypothetical protein
MLVGLTAPRAENGLIDFVKDKAEILCRFDTVPKSNRWPVIRSGTSGSQP